MLNSNIIFVNQLKKFAIEVKTEIGVLASENSTSKFGWNVVAFPLAAVFAVCGSTSVCRLDGF